MMLVALGATALCANAQGSKNKEAFVVAQKVQIQAGEKTLDSQWKGAKVAFLGDSMTDKKRIGTTCVYWEYLMELMGIEPFVYGINGNQWDGIYKQANKLKQEHPDDIDAIIIFAGTNDYNAGLPIGEFWKYDVAEANKNGKMCSLRHRSPLVNDSTFCGRINKVMDYLKHNFPKQQIILCTPIHRAFARFNEKNVQPDENYANQQGLFLESYVEALKSASSMWSVPLIDLHSLCGLYPLFDEQTIYFHKQDTDRLHPNAVGDYRIAKTLQFQLLALPSMKGQ
jgi:lysophospholipase L1-like esterase